MLFLQDAGATGPWDALVKITALLTPVILAYMAWQQGKTSKRQDVIGAAAGVAADSAQESAASAKHLVATVAVNAEAQNTQLNAMQEEGHKTHVLVNSNMTFVKAQNKGLVSLLEEKGIPVPEDLVAAAPAPGPPPFPPA